MAEPVDGVGMGRLGEYGVDGAVFGPAEKIGVDIMLGVVILRPPHFAQRRFSPSLGDEADASELD